MIKCIVPGCVLCPILCPWLPLSKEMKEECGHSGSGDRRPGPVDRVLEEETHIRRQRTDHCKYKYIMLSNGIKASLAEKYIIQIYTLNSFHI